MTQDETIKKKLNDGQQNQQASKENKKRRGGKENFDNNKENKTPFDPANFVTNTKINADWAIPEGKSFSGIFFQKGKKPEKPPSHNGKSFCLMFHVNGVCKKGKECTFNHDDPRDVVMAVPFKEYLSKLYTPN